MPLKYGTSPAVTLTAGLKEKIVSTEIGDNMSINDIPAFMPGH